MVIDCSSNVDSRNQYGRPNIDVSKEEILALQQMNYSWTKVARLIGVSRRTLYRRLQEFGIESNSYSNISPPDFDKILSEVKAGHPNMGERMIQGRLLDMGIKVPRSQLRSAIHRVYHENTIARQSQVTHRRVYSVPHPNAVWHIDGNHKMIRWRLVIHAGVDGFTRLIVFIRCSNNNCSSTVVDVFHEGEQLFGSPNCVRSDCGGENVEVWRHMIEANKQVITGRSTHNERVERMWRDITRCVSSSFIELFSGLEADGILDPSNEVDIFCLHFIFLPRINKSLKDFQGSWNSHSLSSEGNMSPIQLFFEGLGASGISDSTDAEESSGTEVNNSSLVPSDTSMVETPTNKFQPCALLMLRLTAIDPLTTSTDFGRQLYCQCICIVGQHLQSVCSDCKCV